MSDKEAPTSERPAMPGSLKPPRRSLEQFKGILHRAIKERLAELRAQGWEEDPDEMPKTPLEDDLLRLLGPLASWALRGGARPAQVVPRETSFPTVSRSSSSLYGFWMNPARP